MNFVLKYKNLIGIVGAFFLLLFYFMVDPEESRFMPQCFFHKFTGLQCMGCGSQRVLHALLHGDILSAWKANMFLVASLPFIAFLGWVEISRKSRPILYRKIHTPLTIIIISAMLVAWLIVRNILGV